MSRVHIWSDEPGKWGSSSLNDAEDHAEDSGDQVVSVNSFAELKELFKSWVEAGEAFDYLDFHTHGGPGSISLGSGYLSMENVGSLYITNISYIFNAKAKIVFNGCNVADGHRGEFFMLKFGRMMLKHGGGIVLGNTALGFAVPFLGDVYHPGGSWVSVGVSVGGAARLHGHSHLIPLKIQQRLQSAVERIATLEVEWRLYGWQAASVKKLLDLAIKNAALPTEDNMYDACVQLSRIEDTLARIDPVIPRATIKF